VVDGCTNRVEQWGWKNQLQRVGQRIDGGEGWGSGTPRYLALLSPANSVATFISVTCSLSTTTTVIANQVYYIDIASGRWPELTLTPWCMVHPPWWIPIPPWCLPKFELRYLGINEYHPNIYSLPGTSG
jgi:hypothetical protein